MKSALRKGKSRYVLFAFLLTILLGISLIAGSAVLSQASTSQVQKIHIGIFAQVSGLFDSTYTSSMMTAFYNTVFGTGIFDSMEAFSPYGMSYSNTITDTQYTSQINQLANLASSNGNQIRMIFLVGIDLQAAYNQSSHEWTQLVNFVTQTKGDYPYLYALGVNWERDTWGCDAFSCSMRYATAAQLSQAATNIQTLVMCAGLQFISYYGPPISGVTAPSSITCPNGQAINTGGTWLNIGNTDYPEGNNNLSFPDGQQGGWPTLTMYTANQTPFTYIGISNGLFNPYPMPDGSWWSTNYGANYVSTGCNTTPTVTYTSSTCGPSGEWSQTTVNWLFATQKTLSPTYPSFRQWIMLGGDQITGSLTNRWAPFTGQLIDSSLCPTLVGCKFWNSADFQTWVQQAEQQFGLLPSGTLSNTVSSSSTSTSGSFTTSTSTTTTSNMTSITTTQPISITGSTSSTTSSTSELKTVSSSVISSSSSQLVTTTSTLTSRLDSITTSASTTTTTTVIQSTQTSSTTTTQKLSNHGNSNGPKSSNGKNPANSFSINGTSASTSSSNDGSMGLNYVLGQNLPSLNQVNLKPFVYGFATSTLVIMAGLFVIFESSTRRKRH